MIFKKTSYENIVKKLMKKLCKTCDKLATTLEVSYENENL